MISHSKSEKKTFLLYDGNFANNASDENICAGTKIYGELAEDGIGKEYNDYLESQSLLY